MFAHHAWHTFFLHARVADKSLWVTYVRDKGIYIISTTGEVFQGLMGVWWPL